MKFDLGMRKNWAKERDTQSFSFCNGTLNCCCSKEFDINCSKFCYLGLALFLPLPPLPKLITEEFGKNVKIGHVSGLPISDVPKGVLLAQKLYSGRQTTIFKRTTEEVAIQVLLGKKFSNSLSFCSKNVLGLGKCHDFPALKN